MTLTRAHVEQLRRPFTPEAVKWRADQKQADAQGKVRCLVYLDSRLAVERLSEVDPGWTARYEFLATGQNDRIGITQYAPTLCALTVHGVERFGMGQLGYTKLDAKAAKAALSDALKRAAVEFHVGAYLYAMPVFKVDARGYWKKRDETVGGLTPEGVKQLRTQYAKIVNHEKFSARFGEPVDYGDVADDERSAEPVQDDAPSALFGEAPATQAKGQPVKTAKVAG